VRMKAYSGKGLIKGTRQRVSGGKEFKCTRKKGIRRKRGKPCVLRGSS